MSDNPTPVPCKAPNYCARPSRAHGFSIVPPGECLYISVSPQIGVSELIFGSTDSRTFLSLLGIKRHNLASVYFVLGFQSKSGINRQRVFGSCIGPVYITPRLFVGERSPVDRRPSSGFRLHGFSDLSVIARNQPSHLGIRAFQTFFRPRNFGTFCQNAGSIVSVFFGSSIAPIEHHVDHGPSSGAFVVT